MDRDLEYAKVAVAAHKEMLAMFNDLQVVIIDAEITEVDGAVMIKPSANDFNKLMTTIRRMRYED